MSEPAPDWPAFEDDLTDTIGALADGESLVVSAPGATREVTSHARSWRGREHDETTTAEPFVQFLRMGSELAGECVGGPQVSGTFPFDDLEHAALLDEGWRRPGAHDRPGLYGTGWRIWLVQRRSAGGVPTGWYGEADDGAAGRPAVDTIALRSAAELASRTLQRVFGVTDPDAVRVERVDRRS